MSDLTHDFKHFTRLFPSMPIRWIALRYAEQYTKSQNRIRPEMAFMLTYLIWADKKYSDSQPRVPAGSPGGGQWTSGDGGEQNRNLPKPSETPNIQLAAEISGFTKHGINQAINRGVNPSAILDAINNPIKIIPKPNGTVRYVGRDAVVVLNPAGGIVTLWGQ